MSHLKAMQQSVDNYIDVLKEAVAEADYLVYTGEWSQAEADSYLLTHYDIKPAITHTFSNDVVPF
jgi:hypothetical protein